jgi:integrase
MALRQALNDYLALRRSLGYRLHAEGLRLRNFVEFIEKKGATYITTALAVEWALQSLPARAEPAKRLTMVRGLAKYVRALDVRNEIPPSELIPKRLRRVRPYLYSNDEVVKLLEAARSRSRYEVPQGTYYCLLGLLVVTGMRVGEAINLTDHDVDLTSGILTIRGAKFGKSRLVPLHSTTVKVLDEYRKRRNEFLNGRPAVRFFISAAQTPLLHTTIYNVFTAVRDAVSLRKVTGRCPRLHDFRHRFAVRTMINWYQRGEDVERQLPILSTFLGHVSVASTYWYLTEHPELMALAVTRLDERWDGRR